MNVKLVNYTKDAAEMLVLSKRTRHLVGEEAIDNVYGLTQAEMFEELEYVFGTIGSSWEFVDYIFLITNVTRAFTHQLVRHRVGVAFAQQAQRVGTQEDFGYMMPNEFDDNQRAIYDETMAMLNYRYKLLVKSGARPQDARGLLPTNIHTNILFKVNLRALSDLLTVRLCIRAQGEFQNVARKMRAAVLEVHPWAESVLQVNCVRFGCCKFPRFEDCPISQKYPELRWGLSNYPDSFTTEDRVKEEWSKHSGKDPQPDTIKSWEEK